MRVGSGKWGVGRAVALLATALLSIAPPARAQNQVILKRSWVSHYQNRATMNIRMKVRHTHKTPNSPSEDGDLHFSGESQQVGLPFVAEVVNARMSGQATALTAIKAKAGGADSLRVAGAWRLWFEHPSKLQTQGGTNAFDPDDTSPHHSFEIHPATSIDGKSITGSFVPIGGYSPKESEAAFEYFDKATVEILGEASAITISSKRLVNNYVKFTMEVAAAPKAIPDGLIVVASVMKGDQHLTTGNRRMIFIAGTPAAQQIAGASQGDRFTVTGIPRVNLNAVLDLVKKKGNGVQFPAALPYEMIIVAVH